MKKTGSFLPPSICTPPPLLIRNSASSFRSLSPICIDLHNTAHLHSRRLLVGARKKGEGAGEEKKGERFCFHQSVYVVGGGGRKRTEIKTHTTFFLPFCPPSVSWAQMPKKDAKGLAFLSFIVLLPLVLAPQPGPPPCWARAPARKGPGSEARLWERLWGRKQGEAAIVRSRRKRHLDRCRLSAPLAGGGQEVRFNILVDQKHC